MVRQDVESQKHGIFSGISFPVDKAGSTKLRDQCHLSQKRHSTCSKIAWRVGKLDRIRAGCGSHLPAFQYQQWSLSAEAAGCTWEGAQCTGLWKGFSDAKW